MNQIVSVIIPIYNSSIFLSECIESVITQTYENLEIILVNDGSTDNSIDICNNYKKIDKRIIVINQKNCGVSCARNNGLNKSIGEYIYFLDSDDYIDKELISKFIKKVKESGLNIVALLPYTIKKTLMINKEQDILSSSIALRNIIKLKFPTSLWAYFYERKVLLNEQLDNDIFFFEDLEFNVRILSKVNFISIIREKLYTYRAHNNNTNSRGLTPQKLQSYYEIDKVKKLLEENESYVESNYNSFKAHFLVSLIISTFRSKETSLFFKKNLKIETKKIISLICFDYKINLFYKIFLISYFFLPKITTFSYKLSKKGFIVKNNDLS